MKIICDGHDLSDAVQKVFKAISPRTTSPILEGIKLKAEEGTLTLTATDLELSIEKSIVADVKIAGETVVPGKFFTEFVRKLTTEQIELSLSDKNWLKIKYLDSEGELQCLSAEEYPVLKSPSNGQSFIVNQNELKDLINKTAFSASQDDSRPILKGILLEIDNSLVTAVALDGYRLAKCVKPIQSTTSVISAIVPYRCITEIARLLEDSEQTVTVFVEKNYLMVDLIHTKIISRLLDGEFINYRQIIPNSFNSVVTLPTEQFESGLERAILLSRVDKNNLVKFDIKNDVMVLSSNSDIGNVEEKIPVKLNGEDITIAFNARYFTELLKYIGADNITIKFSNPVSPCIATPSGDSDDLIYLILPVRMVQ
jgi:DNA polymerase-3 subunit beta